MKSKRDIIEEKIAANVEEIYNMEIVRDFNLTSDHKEAKVQVDAANDKIKKCEVQLTFLREYLVQCES